MSSSEYVDLIWTTAAEFPGTIFAILIIDYIGRKPTILAMFLIFSLSVLSLTGCAAGKAFLVTALFVARGTSAGVFQVAYVYTQEVYPTNLRAIGMGYGSCFARIGAMLTPFVANVLLRQSFYSGPGSLRLLWPFGMLVGLLPTV